MSFNPNIPRPTDLLSNSQADLLSNNTSINSTFSQNHIPLNVATNNGKHTFVELVANSGSPPTASGEGTLYTFTSGSVTDLWYVPDASGNDYQLTRTNASKFSLFGANNNYQAAGGSNASVTGGWTFLPGGLILNYGSASSLNPGGSITVKYANPFTSSTYSVVVTPRTSTSIGGGNHDWDVSSIVNASFGLTINGNYDSGDTFYFYAIGV